MLASVAATIAQAPVVLIFVAFAAAIVVHEFGHAAVPLLRGGSERVAIEVGIGPRLLAIALGRVDLRLGLLPFAGRVRWNPQVMTVRDYRRLISAGPLANYTVGLIAFATSNIGAYQLLVEFAFASVLTGVLTTIPYKTRNGTSDGYKLRALKRLGRPNDATLWDRRPIPAAPPSTSVPPPTPHPIQPMT